MQDSYSSSVELRQAFNPQTAHKLGTTLQGAIYRVPFANGSFGVVKLASAVLVKRKKSLRGGRVDEDFLNECRVLGYLGEDETKPPTILQAFDWWAIQDRSGHDLCYCLLMESVPGRELFEIGNAFWRNFKENPNSVDYSSWANSAHKIFQQLVLGVEWMHSKGVAHRDLSPENILIIDDGKEIKIRIIDFGLAIYCHEQNFSMTGRVGKLEYMAPEVYAGQRYDGRAADIWCMGTILLFLLGGFNFKRSSEFDKEFDFAMKKGIDSLLDHFGRRLMSNAALHILKRILRRENERVSMLELVKLPYVADTQSCFAHNAMQGEHVCVSPHDVCDDEKAVENSIDIRRLESETFQRCQLLYDDYVCTKNRCERRMVVKQGTLQEHPLSEIPQ